jgi:hypothetical protein
LDIVDVSDLRLDIFYVSDPRLDIVNVSDPRLDIVYVSDPRLDIVRIDGHVGHPDVFVADESIDLLSVSLIVVMNDFESELVQKRNVSSLEVVQVDVEVATDQEVVASC